MLKILHVGLAIIVFVMAVYSLITDNSTVLPLMMFLMSALMLVMGLRELQQERKAVGGLLIVTCLFLLFVSVQSL